MCHTYLATDNIIQSKKISRLTINTFNAKAKPMNKIAIAVPTNVQNRENIPTNANIFVSFFGCMQLYTTRLDDMCQRLFLVYDRVLVPTTATA